MIIKELDIDTRLEAYHLEVQPLLAKYMRPMSGHPGRFHIPSPTYADFLRELQPFWEKYFGKKEKSNAGASPWRRLSPRKGGEGMKTTPLSYIEG